MYSDDIAGVAGAESFQYDALGRLTGRTNDLGAFTLGYLGQTEQVTTRQLASSTLATTWSYLNNAGDRLLSGIANVGLTAGQFSTFAFTSTPEDFVSGITETADTATIYPPTGTQAATYNNLNQLTVLSGQGLTYDAIGNLTSDGTRTYSWDAESRLVGIAYPGQPDKVSMISPAPDQDSRRIGGKTPRRTVSRGGRGGKGRTPPPRLAQGRRVSG